MEKSTAEVYDVVIVGSGATGGTAAKQLTEAGLRTLCLEAGPAFKGGKAYGTQMVNMARQLWAHFVKRRQQVQELHAGYWEVNPDLFVDDKHNPYTTPKDKPYRWIRGRQVGGRSLTWGGVALRFSDYEFKPGMNGDPGQDWPIGYADLAPYYSELEKFLQVRGGRDGVESLPDGELLDPRPLTPAEKVFKEKMEAKFPERRVLASRGIQAARNPAKGETYSRLSSPGTTLAAAQATGRLTVRPDAIVARILVDENTGLATGVEFKDRTTKELHVAYGKIVFLCASTIESLRILMNSKSKPHPDGIGASSGLLGKGLMDHVAGNVYFYMPEVHDQPGEHFELSGSDSFVIPRWVNTRGRPRESYHRGFGIWGGIQRLPFPAALRKKRPAAFGFLCAMGEAIPHDDNIVRLDPGLVDEWGIPAPHIAVSWTENDLAVAKAGRKAAEEMIVAAGGIVASFNELVRIPMLESFMAAMQKEWVVTTPGLFVHEVGGARMGADPKRSVTNPWCQIWDAKNIFVADGACFVSSGWQNPTLTEMAITARAAAKAAQVVKGGAQEEHAASQG